MKEENKEVGKKLGIATVAMFTLPIVVLIASLYIFEHKENPTNWAAAMSIITVNLIIAGYVYVAFTEEDGIAASKDNDASAPRVGVFKQRTD